MDINQLEVLVTVARERSFSRAAEVLDRTQPAISQAIRRLESDVGEKCLHRHRLIQDSVVDFVHFAHAASSQLADDTIPVGNEVARQEGGFEPDDRFVEVSLGAFVRPEHPIYLTGESFVVGARLFQVLPSIFSGKIHGDLKDVVDSAPKAGIHKKPGRLFYYLPEQIVLFQFFAIRLKGKV